MQIQLIPRAEFQRIRRALADPYLRAPLIADMCRANTLAIVKRAGSGHLGSSLSAMDIVLWLYDEVMNTVRLGHDDPRRDIYFSSKGHDVPGLYSVLYSHGILPQEKILKLRRLGGLDGHPDVGVTGVEANSGSLGMGISKGRGMAWAKRRQGYGGRVYVLVGDGELQEGQNYEALQAAVQQGVSNLTVIVDHNKVQSDKPVHEIVDLGDLERKFAAFGWHVARCDGHDYRRLEAALAECAAVADRPQVLIADTLKGRGVSFMEHPRALAEGSGYYRWHAGAPDDESFLAGHAEIMGRIEGRLQALGLEALQPQVIEPEPPRAAPVARNALGEPVSKGAQVAKPLRERAEYVVEAYGEALLELAPDHPNLVVLDADLAADCRTRAFELAYPERFIQNGIAEQDMVSMAGGLARMGLLPVVNSFASFLASRANEQIYNNASEQGRIIYALHYAGLIPAGPGKSHQSLRDISLLAALPNMAILQPCNGAETRMALEYCVAAAAGQCALRLVIGPSPRRIELPPTYRLAPGRGCTLVPGRDALLFAYGPVMLHEALLAADHLAGQNFALQVVNMPWLNRVDEGWLRELAAPFETLFVLEDHADRGGLADHLLPALMRCKGDAPFSFRRFAVEGYPACGAPWEALAFHGLDGASLARRILKGADEAALAG